MAVAGPPTGQARRFVGGGAAGGAVAASEDRDQQRSQMNATRTAEEPTNVSVGGQTSLEQYEDGQAPEQAAHTSAGGQRDSAQSSGQRTRDQSYSLDAQAQTFGVKSDEHYMDVANGDEELAAHLKSQDKYLAEQDDSTTEGTIKEVGKGAVAAGTGAVATAVMAGTGGAAAIPIAIAGGAAGGALGYGWQRTVDNMVSVRNNSVSYNSGDSGTDVNAGMAGGGNSTSTFRNTED